MASAYHGALMNEGTRVKICGVTGVEDARLATELGAWAIGLIFYPKSPRACPPEVAEEIGAQLKRSVEVAGVFVNAPLEELANGNVTPAVAKAPWYFVGLQELLAYFHPTVAGVLVPFYVLVGAALIPYVDRGSRGDGGSSRPSDRKAGVLLFTLFAVAGLVVTFIGAFFRGPGYAWALPWVTGLHFAL